VLLAVLVLAVGGTALGTALRGAAPAAAAGGRPVAAAAVAVPPVPPVPSGEGAAAGPAMARPLGPASSARASAVRIPAIGVRSPLVDLGVDATGALVPPGSADVAGWFTAGAVPGEPGPAVIAGHVDSRAGPGVFYRLGDLPVGAEVDVDRSDGTTVRFEVVAVDRVGKVDFPTEQVYGPGRAPRLSLVTCGGEFDRAAGHYRDNVVVSAVPVGSG
jgi:sortase (surface protein transpeptidase)